MLMMQLFIQNSQDIENHATYYYESQFFQIVAKIQESGKNW